MTDDDKPRFSDALTALGVVCGQQVNKVTLQAYWHFLSDMELAAFLGAVETAGRTLKFFPKPAELRELGGESIKAETAEAWGAVMDAKRRHDYTTSVNFGPLVNAVIANMGGWLRLCDRTLDELVWDRKKFEELYAAFRTKVPSNAPAFLRGAFGSVVVPVAIAGKVPPKALPERDNGIPAVVRELAQAKVGTT